MERPRLLPKACSQAKARKRTALSPRTLSTTFCVPQPIHQSSAPPKVLPAVATKMVGQNKSGLSLIKPNTTGSEPMGNKVADMKDTTNTVLRPKRGSAKVVNSRCIQSIVA